MDIFSGNNDFVHTKGLSIQLKLRVNGRGGGTTTVVDT